MRIKFQTEDGQEQVAEAVSIFSIDENGNEVRTASGGLAVSTVTEESTISVDTGGNTERVSIDGTTDESSAITAGSAVVTPTVDCHVRQGSTGGTAVVPTAGGANGDILLLANNTYRLRNITSGNVLMFITDGTSGHVDITPGA